MVLGCLCLSGHIVRATDLMNDADREMFSHFCLSMLTAATALLWLRLAVT